MKELLTILQAMDKARHTLDLYLEHGERDAEEAVNELLCILDDDEVSCALEKVRSNVGSPSIIPDASSSKKEPIEG